MSADAPPLNRQRRTLSAVYGGAVLAAVAAAWLASVSPLLPWAVLAGAVLAYLVLARPDLFVLALIAILPWQGALRFPTHNVTVVKLVGALLFVSVALSTLLKDRRLRFTPTLGWAVLLCTVVTVSLLANGPNGESLTETLRYWSLALFLFLIVQLIDSDDAFMRAIRVLALSAIVGAAWATVQFLDGSVARASGPISDPNDFAYLLAAVVPFVIYLFATEPRRRWLWGIGLACLALGILGSSSRGAFVALAVVALWALVTRRIPPRALAAALAIVALGALLALGLSSARTSQNLQVRANGLSTSVSLRKVYWSAALRMSANHPLLGIGPGRFQEVSPGYVRNTPVREKEVAVNDTYLALLAETGAIATLVFLGFLASIWLQILAAGRPRGPTGSRPRGPTGDPRRRWLRDAFLASFVLAVVGGIFFSAQLSTPFWVIGALACALGFRTTTGTTGTAAAAEPSPPAGEPSSAALPTNPAAAPGGP